MGTWTDARNIRFSGQSFEKMLEPEVLLPRDPETEEGILRWGRTWSDGLSSYCVVATDNYLYFWRDSDGLSGEWVQAGGPYETGNWQGFAWGNTVVANNGTTAPQIFNQNTLQFEDLPKWGLISTAEDITNGDDPSKDTDARCVCLQPLGSFLVALGVTESGLYRPNTSWWSDASSLVGLDTGIGGTGGPPSWDYESPATLSGKREIGVGDGAITNGAELNENLIIYNESSATAMSVAGGSQVMSSRRLFGNGCAGLNLAAEYNNRHFVVSADRIYHHDGSTVGEIAKDRVQDTFFERAGKGGRYGLSRINFDNMQVINNPDRKEINLVYDSSFFPETPEPLPPYVPKVFAELLYEVPAEGDPARYTPEGCLYVAGSLIMANPAGDEVILSGDLGATWAAVGSLPRAFADGWISNTFAYHPDGAWFVQMEHPVDRETERYRSLDNGQTWEQMSDDAIDNFSSTSMIIDSEGRLVCAARGGASFPGIWIMRWNDPVNSKALSEKTELSLGAFNVDNLKEVDEGYAISIWTGSQQDVWWVPFSLGQETRYSDTLLEDDFTPWSFAVRDQEIGVSKTQSGSTLEWFVFVNDGTVPLRESAVTFPEDCQNGRVQGSPEYVAYAARTQGGDQNRWLVYLAETLQDPVQGPTTVVMPTDISSDTQQNLYWAGGHDWIAHYVEGNRTRIVRFNMAGLGASQREALVYNYEDDNYTWMDAAAESDVLDPVNWMVYGFLPGWQVRWDDLQASGDTWEDLFLAGTKWSDFYSHGSEKAMLWITNKGVHRSDVAVSRVGQKLYYVERTGLDLDDLVPQWTTNMWKLISDFYFHLQSPSGTVVNPNTFTIQFGWSENLMDTPVYEDIEELNLQETDKGGSVHHDTMTAGRYLAMRMTFNATDVIKMTGGDAEAQEIHGR